MCDNKYVDVKVPVNVSDADAVMDFIKKEYGPGYFGFETLEDFAHFCFIYGLREMQKSYGLEPSVPAAKL